MAQIKSKKNAYKRVKANDRDHAHILSGILKCPCCGKSLYGNIAKAHYYYYCKNTVNVTGHKCTFPVNIEQTEMNRMVAAIISAMVNKPVFVNAIKEKIGTAIDTEDMEKELETLRGQNGEKINRESTCKKIEYNESRGVSKNNFRFTQNK